MFIFQPSLDAYWISSIRGSSTIEELKHIADSYFSIAKVSYFDNDAYPDLIICTADRRTLRFLKNNVRANIEAAKREQINPEHIDPSDKLDDWAKTELYTVIRNSKIMDFMVADVNHDGIPDIIMAVCQKEGVCTIVELIFTDTEKLIYTSLEIWFDNNGILQILSANDLNSDGVTDVLYLSQDNTISYVENHDPVYNSAYLINTLSNDTNYIKRFTDVDLNEDGNIDFIYTEDQKVVLLTRVEGKWKQEVIYEGLFVDSMVFEITRSGSNDIVLLFENEVTWLSQMPTSEAKNEEFSFTWTNNKGVVYGYKEFPLEFKDSHKWSSFLVTNLVKKGAVDIIMYSEEEGNLYWGRKEKLNLEGLGWDPNFWIYLSSYVIIMSMAAGLFHAYYIEKLNKEHQKILESQHPSDLSEEWKKKLEMMTPQEKRHQFRKTTF